MKLRRWRMCGAFQVRVGIRNSISSRWLNRLARRKFNIFISRNWVDAARRALTLQTPLGGTRRFEDTRIT